MNFRLLGERDKQCWDTLSGADPNSGFMQSWDWSRFKELYGYTVIRAGIFDGDKLCGGALAYAYATPAELSLLAMPDGPVLPDWNAPGAEKLFHGLCDFLMKQPGTGKTALTRAQPRLEQPPAWLERLPRAPLDLVPDETLLVPLGGGPEAILAGMKQKGRYNTRLAARHGVEVERGTDPALARDFYRILDATGKYHDFMVEPPSFFSSLADVLMPAGKAAFYFARCRGITLAAALAVYHGRQATFLYGGHIPLLREAMAGYAMHRRIMEDAAKAGFEEYDFYGYVPPEKEGHPYFDFSRFKEKFGGRHCRRCGSRDIVYYNRLARAACNAARAAS